MGGNVSETLADTKEGFMVHAGNTCVRFGLHNMLFLVCNSTVSIMSLNQRVSRDSLVQRVGV